MDRIPMPVSEVVVAELADEIALLLPDTGDTVVLNRSAAEVWALCDGARDLSAIVGSLRSRFPESDELPSQVTSTVAELVDRGFLSWRA